jgi:uncharacterized membrane protein YgaE (UPF0421/DUF939 family)
LRTALLAALAVLVAYSIGDSTNFIAADVAAIWALISVKATFHTAVRETVIQVAGTLLGGLIGYAAVLLFGFNIWLMVSLVLFSFLVGLVFRLGVEGAAVIGFTIILVTSNTFSLESTEARISGVVLGTLVATFFSLFVKRGTPQKRLAKELRLLRERKVAVLNRLSEVVVQEGGASELDIFELKLSSKSVVEDALKLRSEAFDILEGALWSPLTKKSEAEKLIVESEDVLSDSRVVVDMVESIDIMRSELPKVIAQKVSEAIKDISSDNATYTKAISISDIQGSDSTPTQVMLSSDLLAGANKIRKRKRPNG